MIIEREVDGGELYDAVRARLSDLLRASPPVRLDELVPATPAWRVRDVLAHVVGIAADLNAGRLPSGDAEQWTAEQVAARGDRTLDEVLGEWEAEAGPFEDGLRLFGYEFGAHFTADLLQHESDVRGLLGAPIVPADDALRAGLDWYLDVAHRSLDDAGAGPIAVVVGGEQVSIGAGASDGRPPVATLADDGFQVFRALGGRRTVDQIASLGWTGDPSPFVMRLSAYPPPLVALGWN